MPPIPQAVTDAIPFQTIAYLAIVAAIVVAIVAWSVAPMVRDARRYRAARRPVPIKASTTRRIQRRHDA